MTPIDRRAFLGLAGSATGWLLGAGRASASPGRGPWVQASATASPEVVVIGAGAFGGWTALHLREMGVSVTLVDAYGPGNARSSSAGETRQIRAAYGDRELYSRWALRAMDLWRQREDEWGQQLLYPTGQITLADGWTDDLRASKATLDRLGVENEILTTSEVARRFPQFDLEGVDFGFHVPGTGVLKCRESCLAVARAFRASGGRLTLARARPGRRTGGRLQDVALSNGRTVAGQSFVFACGPWHPKMFPEILGSKLTLRRRALFFMGTPADERRLSFPNCPTFVTRGVYGFPDIEGKGVKLGPYWDSGSLDPDTADRSVTPGEIARIREFVDEAFPPMAGQPLLETRVSPRTDSIDGHFVVDRHPELENVWIVGGGSGHAFKHGPVLGDHIARRVTGEGVDPSLIETFKLKAVTFG